MRKKLKEKNIKAQSPYPAQLRLFLVSGVKQFPSLLEAQPKKKSLGVQIEMEDWDVLERELAREGWTTQGGWQWQKQQQNPADILGRINEDD